MYPSDARIQLLSDFDERVLRDIAKIIGRAYPRANTVVRDRYTESVARDLYPIERRAIIENSLPLLRDKHPHLNVVSLMNKKRTSSYHQISHNRSVVTQSKTDGPGELPREADFRRTLAESPQLIFEEMRHLVSGPDPIADAVYAIVTHGPAEDDSARVGYMEILIPDATGSQVLGRIDLSRFWDDGSVPTFPVEPITPAAPTLRIVPRKSEEGTGA